MKGMNLHTLIFSRSIYTFYCRKFNSEKSKRKKNGCWEGKSRAGMRRVIVQGDSHEKGGLKSGVEGAWEEKCI